MQVQNTETNETIGTLLTKLMDNQNIQRYISIKNLWRKIQLPNGRQMIPFSALLFTFIYAYADLIIYSLILVLTQLIGLQVWGPELKNNMVGNVVIPLVAVGITYMLLKVKTNWLTKRFNDNNLWLKKQLQSMDIKTMYVNSQKDYLLAIKNYQNTPNAQTQTKFHQQAQQYQTIINQAHQLQHYDVLNDNLTTFDLPEFKQLQHASQQYVKQQAQQEIKEHVNDDIYLTVNQMSMK